jgi:hypothetical protein
MNGWIGQDGRSIKSRGRILLGIATLGFLVVAGMGAGSARGSSIHATALRVARAQQLATARSYAVVHNDAYWSRALRLGLTTQVKVPGGTRLSLQSNGLLPDTAFVTYLRWRQAINPQTFNARHPNVAQLLLQDQVARQTILNPQAPIVPTVPIVTTPSVVRPPSVGPEVITNPPAVPEPSSVVVVGVAFAAAAWARSRRRRMLG